MHVDGARLLGALKVQVDVIVSSPLKRALQTAQFVGTELGYEGKVEVSPALGLSADLRRFPEAARPSTPTAKACWWSATTPTSSSSSAA